MVESLTIGFETLIVITSAMAAFGSACIAYCSLRLMKKGFLLAESQEERRRPSLAVYLDKGFVRHVSEQDSSRVYAFLLLISNTSDMNNSVARIDLHLTYIAPTQLKMTVKFPSDLTVAGQFSEDQSHNLMPPFRLDSHRTVAGWICFRADEELLQDTTVEGYAVVVTDSHGNYSTVESVIVREIVDEVDQKESINPIS